MKSRIFKLAMLGWLCVPLPGGAEVFDIADGDFVGLRGAMREAANNDEPDTILLAPGGQYQPSGSLALEPVQGNLRIYGQGATIDGTSSEGNRLLQALDQSMLLVADLNILNVSYEVSNSFHAGGVLENNGTTTLRNVTIANTTVSSPSESIFGGAIANAGDLTLENVTLSGNRIVGRGSGSALHNVGDAFILNSTLTGNAFENDTGGGAALDASSAQATTVQNTIIADNSPSDCGGSIDSSGGNLDTDGTCDLDKNSDKPGINARLLALGNNGGRVLTHALNDNSPALDAGRDAFCSVTDARGVPRPPSGNRDTGPACDMGAHENRTAVFEFTDAASGSWFNPDQNGHGFMFEKLPDGRLLVTWFVFDPAGNRDWIQAFGEIRDGIAHMSAYQVLGGVFPPQFDPKNTTLTYWGTLSVVFNGCNAGAVAWHSDTLGYGNGGTRLTRLTSVSGTNCD